MSFEAAAVLFVSGNTKCVIITLKSKKYTRPVCHASRIEDIIGTFTYVGR